MLTAKSACLRCTTVDFERPTSDEAVVEARRDALPAARWEALEYAVHGKFRMREGGVSFPDTFWYSLKELRTAGCSRANLRAAVGSYEEEMAAASEAILCDMSDSEAEEESEGEDDQGSAEDDAGAEGQGEGLAGEVQARLGRGRWMQREWLQWEVSCSLFWWHTEVCCLLTLVLVTACSVISMDIHG